MKESYTQLYSDMHTEIGQCMQQPLSEKEIVEKCFWISRNYSKKLKELINIAGFDDENEEICFFRNVKPQFVCYIEYFLLISEALSIVPGEKDAAIKFWEEEKDRFQVFRQKHESFVSYFENGKHDSDTTYFLRENNNLRYVPNLRIYDTDIDWCTSHARLVRNYLAYKEYEEYCNKKLAGLILERQRN